jgi:hypothetical protein
MLIPETVSVLTFVVQYRVTTSMAPAAGEDGVQYTEVVPAALVPEHEFSKEIGTG